MEDFEARIKTLQEGYSLVEEFINTGFKSKEKECWRTVYFFAEWLNEKGIKDIKLVEGFGWKDDSLGIDENFYHWNLIYKDRWLDVLSMVEKGENFKSILVEPKTKRTPLKLISEIILENVIFIAVKRINRNTIVFLVNF